MRSSQRWVARDTHLAVCLVHHGAKERRGDAAWYRPEKHSHLLLRHDVTGGVERILTDSTTV